MFDTHCHLNFDVFGETTSKVILEAKRQGVSFFLIPGVDLESSKKAIETSKKYDEIYCACGLHPTLNFASVDDNTLNKLESLLTSSDKVVAVGEIGLDSYKGKSSLEVQKKFLKKQIKLAIKHNLSVILHNRQASEALIEVLREVWSSKLSKKVVFHCVEPSKSLLDFAKKKKIFMGIDGDITYNKKKQDFLSKIPLDLLVLETDSPFLVPEPLKSKGVRVNEPKNVTVIAQTVSRILKKEKSEIKEITTKNAKVLFNMLE